MSGKSKKFTAEPKLNTILTLEQPVLKKDHGLGEVFLVGDAKTVLNSNTWLSLEDKEHLVDQAILVLSGI